MTIVSLTGLARIAERHVRQHGPTTSDDLVDTDADTLDDVMDTIDSLRDGGRVVGVVSHVAEMRDRIPTQLVVTKARTGSTVSLRG